MPHLHQQDSVKMSWARDNIVATTWPCYHASKLLDFALILYIFVVLWLLNLHLDTETLIFLDFFLVPEALLHTLSRCPCRAAKKLSRAQLWKMRKRRKGLFLLVGAELSLPLQENGREVSAAVRLQLEQVQQWDSGQLYRYLSSPVPKVIDFPRYNMKCSGENVTLPAKFHIV